MISLDFVVKSFRDSSLNSRFTESCVRECAGRDTVVEVIRS